LPTVSHLETAMPGLIQFLSGGAAVTGVVVLLYSGTITVVALTAVLASTRERRRDARDTLRLLLRYSRNR